MTVDTATITVTGHPPTIQGGEAPQVVFPGGTLRPLRWSDELPEKVPRSDVTVRASRATLRVVGLAPTPSVSVLAGTAEIDRVQMLRDLREELAEAEDEAELWALGLFD